MFNKPREAKKLHFDVIPKAMDDYLSSSTPIRGRTGRTGWAIRSGTSTAARRPRRRRCRPIPLGRTSRVGVLRAAPQPRGRGQRRGQGGALGLHPPLCAGRGPEDPPQSRPDGGYAVRYFRDFVKPAKRYRAAERMSARRWSTSWLRSPAIAAEGVTDPARSRTASSTSAGATRGGRPARTAAGTWADRGSRCSIRCCWARSGAPASARSWRSTVRRTRGRWVERALSGALTGARGVQGRPGGLTPHPALAAQIATTPLCFAFSGGSTWMLILTPARPRGWPPRSGRRSHGIGQRSSRPGPRDGTRRMWRGRPRG